MAAAPPLGAMPGSLLQNAQSPGFTVLPIPVISGVFYLVTVGGRASCRLDRDFVRAGGPPPCGPQMRSRRVSQPIWVMAQPV